MHKGSSKKRTQDVISCKQLDFGWRPISPKSKGHGETAETDVSTIGRPLSSNEAKADRLFVPLADQPFAWFRSGKKKWELRRLGRQYTQRHVRVGRRVELRRGYRGPDVLWGEILAVIEANGIEDFFEKVDFKDVVPVADSREDAVRIATEILRIDSTTPLLGFAVGHL
jgi:ASC-1-like (ASCH) protein